MIGLCLYRLLVLSLLVVSINASFKRVCYFSNWSQYRQHAARFSPADIEPNLCTHIVYAFASMEGNKLKTLEENDVQLYRGVNDLKKRNPSLKTLLGVGGWNFGTQKMTAMLATDHNRREFAKTTVDFLRKYDFDGIDLDFEYPGSRGSPAEDKQRYARLVQEMRQAFEEDAYLTGKPRLLLTAAVAAGKGNIDRGYDAKALARSLDFINVMTYDLHGPWDKKVGHNSPMYASSGASESERQLTVEWAAKYWVSLGVPRNMLVIGLPTYGRCFTLQNPSLNKMGDPITGPGKQGKFTRESGFLAYYEVCDMKKQGASVVDLWDNEQQVPYLYQGDQWVGYDNVRSLTQKVQWIKQQDFGGWMVWNLDLDDFRGSFCGEGKFPLISAMKRAAAQGSGSGQSYQTSQYTNNLSTDTGPAISTYVKPSAEKYKPPQQSSFVKLSSDPYNKPAQVQVQAPPVQQINPIPVYSLPNVAVPVQTLKPVVPQPPLQPFGQPPPTQQQQQPRFTLQQIPQYQPNQQQTQQQQQPQAGTVFQLPQLPAFTLPSFQQYQPPKPPAPAPKPKPQQSYTPPKQQVYKPKKQTYTAPKVQKYTPPKQKYTPPKQKYTAPKVVTKRPIIYQPQTMKPYDPEFQLSFATPNSDSIIIPTQRPRIYQTKPKPQAPRRTSHVSRPSTGSTVQTQNTFPQQQIQNTNKNNNNNNNNNNNIKGSLSLLPGVIELLDQQTKDSYNLPSADQGFKWVILPVYAIHPNAANNINSVQDIDSVSLSDLTTDLSYSQANPPQAFDTTTANGLIAVCTRLGPGIHAHPNEHCFRYLMCDHRNGFEMRCEHGTVYDPASKVCQWPRQVPSRVHCST